MKKCGRCPKPAVLHITEIQGGAVEALHLCESCAKDYLNDSSRSEEELDVSEVEANAVDSSESADGLDLESATCPNCGLSFKEFRSQGRLGCGRCYAAFQPELIPLLENIHNAEAHTGKVPKREPQSSQRHSQLMKLRSALRVAVEDEHYEEAARLRDEIRQLESARSPESDEGDQE